MGVCMRGSPEALTCTCTAARCTVRKSLPTSSVSGALPSYPPTLKRHTPPLLPDAHTCPACHTTHSSGRCACCLGCELVCWAHCGSWLGPPRCDYASSGAPSCRHRAAAVLCLVTLLVYRYGANEKMLICMVYMRAPPRLAHANQGLGKHPAPTQGRANIAGPRHEQPPHPPFHPSHVPH